MKPPTARRMAQAETDLGTRLEWVAGIHHDGGKPHVHVILRGRDEDGNLLGIDPGYVTDGFRTRAREFATYDPRHGLGERSDAEVAAAQARSREIRALRREGRELVRAARDEGVLDDARAERMERLVDKASAPDVARAVDGMRSQLRRGHELELDRDRGPNRSRGFDLGY